MNYLKYSEASGLTDSEVMQIRYEWHSDPSTSIRKISQKYNRPRSTVGDIIAGRTWTHVPDAQEMTSLKNYVVFADGRIYSYKSKKFLTHKITNDGVTVRVVVNGKQKDVSVASVVAKAFHGSSKKLTYVDGNPHNVHFTNLKVS